MTSYQFTDAEKWLTLRSIHNSVTVQSKREMQAGVKGPLVVILWPGSRKEPTVEEGTDLYRARVL